MTIQERAKAALREHVETLEPSPNKKRLLTAALVKSLFEDWYGEMPDQVCPSPYDNCAIIFVDGLQLYGFADDPDCFYMALVGNCPECGAEEESPTFTELWELGELLENFRVGDWHECGDGQT